MRKALRTPDDVKFIMIQLKWIPLLVTLPEMYSRMNKRNDQMPESMKRPCTWNKLSVASQPQ